jgi:hypothetical protein
MSTSALIDRMKRLSCLTRVWVEKKLFSSHPGYLRTERPHVRRQYETSRSWLELAWPRLSKKFVEAATLTREMSVETGE